MSKELEVLAEKLRFYGNGLERDWYSVQNQLTGNPQPFRCSSNFSIAVQYRKIADMIDETIQETAGELIIFDEASDVDWKALQEIEDES